MTKKQQSYGILGGIFVIVALVIAAIVWTPAQSDVAGVQDSEQVTDTEFDACSAEESEQRDTCFRQLAVSRSDISLCGFVSGTQNPQCIKDVAFRMQEYQLCLDIEHEFTRSQCLLDVGVSIANPDTCARIVIPAMRMECATGIAEKLNDERVCEKLRLEAEVQECKTRLTNTDEEL